MSEPTFFKSSYSSGSQNCVEVADTPTATLIRDTQNRAAGHLDIPRGEWSALIRTC